MRIAHTMDTAVLTSNLLTGVNLFPFTAMHTLDVTARSIIHFGQVAELRLPT